MKLRKAREAGVFAVELAKSGRKPSELIAKEILYQEILLSFDMRVVKVH